VLALSLWATVYQMIHTAATHAYTKLTRALVDYQHIK